MIPNSFSFMLTDQIGKMEIYSVKKKLQLKLNLSFKTKNVICKCVEINIITLVYKIKISELSEKKFDNCW